MALSDGSLTQAMNIVAGMVEPPEPGDLTRLPEPGEPGYDEALAAGVEALRDGEIALLVLAGGMATRFGGGVKAVAEAFDGMSFLEVKLRETERLRRALGAEIPVALMTSFATDEVVRAHVARARARGAALLHADRGAAAAAGRVACSRRRRARVPLRPRAR